MNGETATLTLERYAPDAKAWVSAAQQLADERQHREVRPLHLLARALERDPGIQAVFKKSGVVPEEVRSAVDAELNRLPRGSEQAFLSDPFLALLKRAERQATAGLADRVEVEHLLNALTEEIRGPVADVLGGFKIGPGALKGYMAELRSVRRPSPHPSAALTHLTRDWVRAAHSGALDPVIGRNQEIRRVLTILERRHKGHPLLVGEAGVGKGAILRGLASRVAASDVPLSLLDVRLLEVDVGALTSGSRLRGEVEARMRKLIEQSHGTGQARAIFVIRSLERVLGAGPTAPGLAELFVSALSRGQLCLLATTTPEGYTRIEADNPALLRFLTPLTVAEPGRDEAAAIVRGLASRFEAHHRVRVSEGAVESSVVLAKRYLSERFLPDSALDLLDETSAIERVEVDGMSQEVDDARSELLSLQAQHKSLAGLDDERSERKLAELEGRISELSPRVEGQRTKLEARRGAVAAVRQLSRELTQAQQALLAAKAERQFARLGKLEHETIPELERRLEKAETAVAEAGGAPSVAMIDEAQVARTVAAWTGIPVAKMLEEETEKLLKMEQRLAARVVGQPEAVQAISKAIRRGRVGLRDPRRPIGSFLFLGSSGVGKTELAKALAEFLFDDEQALTRLDMSEFMERHMAQRLLGAPPGYADSEQGGFLTEAVRKRPYSVLLFDEVEKAHHDVFNLLLQVLDDGRLTDGRGRLADFTNTVVIMTSNIGSERIVEAQENVFATPEGRQSLTDVLLDRLAEFFRPEFLNRVGEVVVFRPLSREDLLTIVELQLQSVQKLLARRQMKLELSHDAKQRLVELGYEPALGARPLQRAIVRHLQDPLAEELLKGGYRDGQTISVTLAGAEFSFSATDP